MGNKRKRIDARLARRQADFDRTIGMDRKVDRGAYRRPGSQKK